MSSPAFRRVLRRETHSPRTVAMIVAVVILLLALVYVGIEIVLFLLAQPALLLGPGAGLAWLVGLPGAQPAGLTVAGGVVLVVIGLVFLFLAITPGRLARHEMQWGDRAVVVDNGVIAAALAQRLSEETGLARDAITVGVGHRNVDVTVRTGPGIPLDKDRVQSVADAEMAEYRLSPSVKTRVRVDAPKDSEDAL